MGIAGTRAIVPARRRPWGPCQRWGVTESFDWIAVDWGTSNLRVWGMAGGVPVLARSSDRGMARLTAADYPAALTEILGDDLPTAPMEVLICGMAGARQGWREAPYLEAPADLGSLCEGAVIPPMPAGSLRPRILPGICQRETGSEDVMRGEETQLLGLLDLRPGFSGTVIMPGTHSKWARLDARRIERFTTAMTGEIYEALSMHTVLRHSLAGDSTGPDQEAGIDIGLTAGLETPQLLTSQLFKTRSAALLSQRGPDWCAGYLSGLLVGAEVGGHRDWLDGGPVPLIGSPRLCRIYGEALRRLGVASESIDATEAVLAGLVAARQQGNA